jgi:hypothetical protein
MQLNPEQKHRLVEALRAAFPDPGDMGLVVGLADIGTSFADAPKEATYPQALDWLINWADAQDRIEDLLWAARERNIGNPKLQGVFKELLPEKGALIELEPLLRGLDSRWRDEGGRLYNQIALAGWARRLDGQASLDRLAQNLARMPDRTRTEGHYVPLLVFVQELAKRIKADPPSRPQADPLDQWLAQTEKDLGVPRWSGPISTEMRTPGTVATVLVRIAPPDADEDPAADPSSLRIRVRLFHGTEPDPEPLIVGTIEGIAGGEGTHLEALRQALSPWIDRCRKKLIERRVPLNSVRFQFLLPRSLIGLEVELIEVPIGSTRPPLGALSPVTVRPLEREDGTLQFQILSQYAAVLERELESCMLIKSLNDPSNGSLEAVFIQGGTSVENLLLDLLYRPMCCLSLLETPPHPQPVESGDDLYSTLLAAYVPFALWFRQGPPAGDVCASLCSIIKDQALGAIPQHVRERRRDDHKTYQVAAAGAVAAGAVASWFAGRYLTLLWDDPRIPPSPQADPRNQLETSR